jgi:hypothetical protein
VVLLFPDGLVGVGYKLGHAWKGVWKALNAPEPAAKGKMTS